MTRLLLVLLLSGLLVGLAPVPMSLAQDDGAAGESLSWPRELETEKLVITIYQPQIESFRGDILESRAAVSVKVKESSKPPVFGAVWMRARMATDMDTRLVSLLSLEVDAAKFPDASEEHIEKLSRYLEQEIPKWDLTLSLDRLLATVEEAEQKRRPGDDLNNAPPEIIVRNRAAVLVMIDGEPKLTTLEGTDLRIVVNTAYFIVQDPSGQYYLKGGPDWFTSRDLMQGWQPAGELPGDVAEVARRIEEDEKKAKEEDPDLATSLAAEQEEVGKPETPEIILRTGPAELVETFGKPDMASIEGTELLYVKNSETDIVFDIAAQKYYLLLSGRWYRAADLNAGEWEFVPFDDLPGEFAEIPEASDMAAVRPSVPGTPEAREAALENQIPQTAEVSRAEATVQVEYDGDPKFETCGDNGVSYAVNTDKSVLLIGGTYWVCDDAVWFTGKGPEGPWEVADSVPEEVQDLPPECPVYNVKYVYIYDSTPEVVYVGYTPGYVGSYYWGGCVVYGTGYWYRPWYSVYYYPRPVTYGFGVHYNPYTGWGFHYGVSFGWLHVGVSWGRPWYGSWYGGCWGAAGYRYGYRHGYHHGYRHGYRQGARAGYYAGLHASQRPAYANNLYRKRPEGVKRTGTPSQRPGTAGPAQRPGTSSQRPGTSSQRPGTGTPSQRPGTGTPSQRPGISGKAPRPSQQPNNVYADPKGNVYRNQGGNWQKSTGRGGWSSAGGNRSTQQQLNRSQQSRQRSNQRAQGAGRARSPRGGGGRRR